MHARTGHVFPYAVDLRALIVMFLLQPRVMHENVGLYSWINWNGIPKNTIVSMLLLASIILYRKSQVHFDCQKAFKSFPCLQSSSKLNQVIFFFHVFPLFLAVTEVRVTVLFFLLNQPNRKRGFLLKC